MAASMAQQRYGLGQVSWAVDTGATDVLRRAFFGQNVAAEPCVASVPDCCTKNILYGAVAALVHVACAHLHR